MRAEYEALRAGPDAIRIALINGEHVEYDVCVSISAVGDTWEPPAAYGYIGMGKIYSINGVIQGGNRIYHFAAFKERK